MTDRERKPNVMLDVPDMDFIDAVCEIWSPLSYAAYHLAYVRVYSQAAALQTDVDEVRKQDQVLREIGQADVVICRAHLAAFFWQLDHVFEALRIAITRGQKEHSDLTYFWGYEKKLDEIEKTSIRQQINAYRNISHQTPAIIGCAWDKRGGTFLHHFLPSIRGREQEEPGDMNAQLKRYFESVANWWLDFVPGSLKDRFPRSFKFTVTVPNSFLGELPVDLKEAPQLEVSIEAYEKSSDNQGH